MKCFDCGKEEALPFTCPYCKQQFCAEHRLPENHLCPSSPARAPLGAALAHKDPYSLTKPKRRNILESSVATNTKRSANAKFSSEGSLHFVRNPDYKQRKRLKRAAKIIVSLVVIAALGYCLWIASPSIIQSIIQYTTQQPTPTSTPLPTNTNSEIETQIFQLINVERANRGLPTLQNDTSLTTIAKSWSNQIAETHNLTHGNFMSRLTEIGIYTYGFQYGEIIESYGSTTGTPSTLARIFVDGWLDSQGHREIMLTALSGYMGVGASRKGSTLYGVVDFKFIVG